MPLHCHRPRSGGATCGGAIDQVRVLLDFGGNTELLYLAESIIAAELSIAREGYRNARLEIVGAEDGERAGGADLAA